MYAIDIWYAKYVPTLRHYCILHDYYLLYTLNRYTFMYVYMCVCVGVYI